MKKFFISILMFAGLFMPACENPVYAAQDPAYIAKQFFAAHPEINTALENPAMLNSWLNTHEYGLYKLLDNVSAGTISFVQTTLNNGSVLTIWFLSNVDSNATVLPHQNNFFDASQYTTKNDTAIYLDSVLYAVRVKENGTGGSDSVLIRRLGTFNPVLHSGFSGLDTLNLTSSFAVMDTIGSNKGTIYEAHLNSTGTKITYSYPFQSFAVSGILCQGPSVLIFVWNLKAPNSKN